jgi:glutaredoxin
MKYCSILLILFSVGVEAEVFKWTDVGGRTHYGSRPGSEKTKTLRIESGGGQVVPSSPKVVMYSTSWCPYCAKARTHFRARNICFSEQDIENRPSAKRAYDQLHGNGVPLVLVGNQRMQGFDAQQFESLFQQQLEEMGR